ncbi:hypothetical protein [Streptacidiphilus sp. MAP5-3]|uniref:hypothetical protein n=1 Tax=unclassified Streptacidiphilus TaxID=2643834 RepID=UPI00351547F2
MGNDAKQLMANLYANGAEFDADWSGVSDEAMTRLREASESGDAAVQSVLTNLAFSKFEDADQARRLAASLAGIKQAVTASIFDELPTTSIDDLRAAAEAAGYEVEVLA